MKLVILLTAVLFSLLACDQLPWLSPQTDGATPANTVQDEVTAGNGYFYFTQSAPSGSLIPIKGSANFILTLYGASNFTLYFGEGPDNDGAPLSGQLDTQETVSLWANTSLSAQGTPAALQLLGGQKSTALALMNVSRPKIDTRAGTLQYTVAPSTNKTPFPLLYRLSGDQPAKMPAHFGQVILIIAAQGDMLQPILNQYQALYQHYEQRLQSASGIQGKNKQQVQQYQEQLAHVQQEMERTKGEDPQIRQKFEDLQQKLGALQTEGNVATAPDSQLTEKVQALRQEIQRLLAVINDGTKAPKN